MKPILFSTPMVQAILDGRKTMTRRVVKPQPKIAYRGTSKIEFELHPFRDSMLKEATGLLVEPGIPDNQMAWVAYDWCGNPVGIENADWLKPTYKVGDILWVRETWNSFFPEEVPATHQMGPRSFSGVPAESARGHYMHFFYRADGDFTRPGALGITEKACWEPSIHMPKEAARIFLRVTDVRVERLQEISYDDCLSEGMHDYGTDVDTFAAFQELWQELNDKRGYGWDANPWVWVISFERCEKPQEVQND